MAIIKYWMGSHGPFFYDDADTYPDAEPVVALRTEGRLRVDEAPVDPNHAVRLGDVSSLLAYLDQAVLTTSSPTFVTVKLTGLTDGYVPYHVNGATGLANSPIFTDGTSIGIGTVVPDAPLHICKDNATAIIRLERNDTTIGTDDIVGRIEVEGQDADAPGICAKIEAIAEGTAGETGWRFSAGIAGAATELMRLTYLGYLGIGTPEPDALLHLEDPTGAVQRLTRKDTTVSAADIIGRIEFETQDAGGAGVAAYIQAVAEGSNGEVGLALATGTGGAAVERVRVSNTGGVAVAGAFGCNGAAAQAVYAVNIACTDLATVIALCNQLRAALIANGVCV